MHLVGDSAKTIFVLPLLVSLRSATGDGEQPRPDEEHTFIAALIWCRGDTAELEVRCGGRLVVPYLLTRPCVRHQHDPAGC